MANFNGRLNANEYYNSLYNAYALIQTFADNISGLDGSLASRFKSDGGMYKDKSVFTSMDILKSRVWDPTDTNVLATEQKVKPVQQEIVLDQKRQIGLTTENYLTKRAWMNEGAFSAFNATVQAQIGNTKKVYEQRLVDTAVGTMEAEMPEGKGAGQAQNVSLKALPENATFVETEAYERMKARKIGKKIADIFVDVKDSTRDFNDYGHMTSYNKDNMLVIWNKDYLNNFEYVDLPTIFHKEGIIDFTGEALPGRYFGTTADLPANADGATIRILEEKEIGGVNYFPGDLLPNGTALAGIKAYKTDDKIICKIVHNNSIKYLSSFETSTEFFNDKNLSQNRYLTWMYANPDYLRNYPLITVREVVAG